jgi:hypothetical protein
MTNTLLGLLEWDNDDPVADETTERRVRQRLVKKHVFETMDDDGTRHVVHPRGTLWYALYVKNPMVQNTKFLNKFRRRFCIPYDKFLELVDIAKQATDDDGNLYFRRWMSSDATGIPSSPIELLILGSLRYLGRGWYFDDIEEATAISEEVHRCFFHVFIKFGAEVLYKRWVIAPTTQEEADEHMYEMRKAGFNGSIGSTDATHVLWHRCSYKHRQAHLGYKMSQTARSYNITVNHRRRILWSTQGLPARWNDKTVVMFDDFARGIYEGRNLIDV